MSNVQQKHRVNALVSRQLNHPEGNDLPATMELVDIIRRGLGEEVLLSLKEPLKHGPPQVQLRSLGAIDACVTNSGPEFALILSREEWTDRLFRVAKSASPEVSTRLMTLVYNWCDMYATTGLRSLVDRFMNSQNLGAEFKYLTAQINEQKRLRQRMGSMTSGSPQRPSLTPQQPANNSQFGSFNQNQQQQQQQQQQQGFYNSNSNNGAGGNGSGRPSAGTVPRNDAVYVAPPTGLGGSSSARTSAGSAAPSRAVSVGGLVLTNLEAFLLEAQGDLASLEYGLEHPDVLEEQIARDCNRHRMRCDSILQNPNLPDGARGALMTLLEQLTDLLGIFEVIKQDAAMGGVVAAGAARAGNMGRAPDQPPSSGEDDDDGRPAGQRGPRTRVGRAGGRGAGSSAMQAELAAVAVDANTARLLDNERKECAALRQQLEQKQQALEELQQKYKDAKDKNKKAVSLVQELSDKCDAADQQIAQLRAGGPGAAVAVAMPAPPPPVSRAPTQAAARVVDRRIVASIRDNISALRRCFRGLRDDSREIKKESDVFAAEVGSSVNHVLKASVADRANEKKALQWMQELYQKELKLRKQYYNVIQELKGNIRVYCRVRPMSNTELSNGHTECTTFPTSDEVRVVDDKGKMRSFEFDAVFPGSTTQEAVFADTAPLIDSVVDGYNVCIFAYGQTGSGKTFTMSGYEDKGINRRALDRLFEIINERGSTEKSTVVVSVLEIYCETIKDLLMNPREAARTTFEVKTGGGTGHYVSNLTEITVESASEIDNILARATAHRTEGRTDMNAHSSRSHMILYVVVRTTNVTTGVQSYGKLSLVDLAGSERLDKSGSEGQMAKEAMAINKSLSALGDVIANLSQSAKHVPFRNSQLTFLLQDSMQGQAKVLMFVCASPASYNSSETLSSLGFATRARGVALGQVKKNVVAN